MTICQFFIHKVDSDSDHTDQSLFLGMRKPALGSIQLDAIAQRIAKDD